MPGFVTSSIRCRPRRLHHLALLALVIGGVSMPAEPAGAAISPCTTQVSSHVGYNNTFGSGSNDYWGARVTATWAATPGFCNTVGGIGNKTLLSELVTSSVAGQGWSQAEIYSTLNSGGKIFESAQWTVCATDPSCGFHTDFGNELTVGQQYYLTSQTNGNCGGFTCMQNYVGLDLVDSTVWSPLASWSSPFDLQYFGETHYKESDIPGTSSNQSALAALEGQQAFTFNFPANGNPYNPPVNQVPKRYAVSSPPYLNSFLVWTSCPTCKP
jgi:hypothetical protein